MILYFETWFCEVLRFFLSVLSLFIEILRLVFIVWSLFEYVSVFDWLFFSLDVSEFNFVFAFLKLIVNFDRSLREVASFNFSFFMLCLWMVSWFRWFIICLFVFESFVLSLLFNFVILVISFSVFLYFFFEVFVLLE